MSVIPDLRRLTHKYVFEANLVHIAKNSQNN